MEKSAASVREKPQVPRFSAVERCIDRSLQGPTALHCGQARH